MQQLDQPDDAVAKEKAALRLSAMNVLAMREHSRFELERKLAKKFEDMDLIAQVLDKLQIDNLLSDQRFATAFIQSKANNGFGPYKIEQDLRGKGVANTQVSDAFAELSIDWYTVASELYQKRTNKLSQISIKEKHKQIRYLHTRGFSGEIVHAVVGSLDDDG